jgi:hypothetical protein
MCFSRIFASLPYDEIIIPVLLYIGPPGGTKEKYKKGAMPILVCFLCGRPQVNSIGARNKDYTVYLKE